MDIFEDVALEEAAQQAQPPLERKRRSRTSILPQDGISKRSTILAHPAQKVPIVPLPVPEIHHNPAKPSRRRVSQILNDRHVAEISATVQLKEDVLDRKESRKETLRKDPRRRTIYIPSEDTTIMTIHPGQPTHPSVRSNNARVKEPDFGLDLVTLSEEEEQLVPALKQSKKTSRKSLAVPPKRVPLLQSARGHGNVTFAEDVVGSGGGKENIPPGMELHGGKASKQDFFLTKDTVVKAPKVHFSSAKTVSVVKQSKTKVKPEESRKRVRSVASFDGSSPGKSLKAKAGCNPGSAGRKSTSTVSRPRPSRTSAAGPLSSSPFHTDRSPPTALRRKRQEQAPSKLSILHIVGKPPEPREKYPVLTEDLAKPELYEDHWLTYQEVAITQLVNSLFDSAKPDADINNEPGELRKKLLALYHEPEIPVLHKRLQASLTYGALSIPKDLLSQTLRLKDDVGLRRKFLNLWVQTYDLTVLRAALETVIGRQIPVSSRLSSGSNFSDDGNSRQFRAERRAIEGFIDAFLIRNEDAVRVKGGVGSIGSIARGEHHHQSDDFGSQAWAWRRTVLRSLMLLHLLDKAKAADILPTCLFQSSSLIKSSVELLQALATMLIPSIGDITRPLSHFSYSVSHIQYPLQEYNYHIENLATDLRNGVILTRIVELLLYSPHSSDSNSGDEVTITLPTGEILTSSPSSSQNKESWPLSQHLKFPALGRAQKVYNVQVALSALNAVHSLPTTEGIISADDIVDGHREKTLSLLWSVVGRFGLGNLVDWKMLGREVRRFRERWYRERSEFLGANLDSDNEDDCEGDSLGGMEHQKKMLLEWARGIARFRNLRVTNLTTSFSNPKVLESIVDAYLPSSLLGASNPSSSSSASDSGLGLAAKLKLTGCSTAFISLFTSPNPTTIPSKDFTILTLAFLASRLLPLSIRHRAASTIQRAYRLHLAKRSVSQRIQLMKLAHACKSVVQERERVVRAATVVQRRWRAIVRDRNERLYRQIEGVQALARGWILRRWARRVTGGRVGGKERIRRVRGGW